MQNHSELRIRESFFFASPVKLQFDELLFLALYGRVGDSRAFDVKVGLHQGSVLGIFCLWS